jgi:hypothetical protein
MFHGHRGHVKAPNIAVRGIDVIDFGILGFSEERVIKISSPTRPFGYRFAGAHPDTL